MVLFHASRYTWGDKRVVTGYEGRLPRGQGEDVERKNHCHCNLGLCGLVLLHPLFLPTTYRRAKPGHSACHRTRNGRGRAKTMKSALLIIPLVEFFSFAGSLHAEEQPTPTIAVVNLENTSGSPTLDYLNRTISEYVNTYLVGTGRIRIVERERLQEASLQELQMHLTDIVDASTSVRLGKIVGAKMTIIGSFMKVGDTLLINARLIEVETGEALLGGAVQEQGKEDELFNLLDRLSEALKKVILEGTELSEEKEALSTLFIQSNPPGASIYINGQPYGFAPKDIYNLQEGTYEVVLSKVGYETYIKKINLSIGDEVPLQIDLSPQKGTLIIISNPEEAEVYLDTEYRGVTKLTLEDILTGTHQVTFKKKGYYEEERRVEVIYKEDTTLEVTLKEKPGSLLILSSPQEARVYLDEEYKGKTPLSLPSVSPGEHKIRITKEGRATHYETALVKGEENTTVDVVLSANNPPRITSLTAKPETIKTKETTTITATATDPDKDNLSYRWSTTQGSIQGQGEKITYQAPSEPGTYSIKVTVSDNNGGEDNEEITIRVEKQTGTLKITSYPPGADIYLDQAYKGKTPLALSSIEVGGYRVKAANENEVKEETVEVRANQISLLEFSFVPEGMALIPAGEFLMGSNDGGSDEKPVHSVYLDAYYIDKYEVTNEQFSKFLNEKGNQGEGGATWVDIDDEDCLIEYKNGKYQPRSGYENHPVVEVSWYGARAYAKWAGKRLPTEAEWEKAARGGLIGKKYPWGDSIDSSKANYDENLGRTTPVGSYPPNNYGLYDMAGNVWEWVSDWHDYNYYSSSNSYTNPQGPNGGSYRVLRGGGCYTFLAGNLRCANRGCNGPVARTTTWVSAALSLLRGFYPSTFLLLGQRCEVLISL